MGVGIFKCECVKLYFGDYCEKGKWKLNDTIFFSISFSSLTFCLSIWLIFTLIFYVLKKLFSLMLHENSYNGKKDQKTIQETSRPNFALITKVSSISTGFLNMRKIISESQGNLCLFIPLSLVPVLIYRDWSLHA